MEAMIPLFIKILFGAMALFGGAAALENSLENYVMSRVPAWAKGAVVPVISTLFAFGIALQGGASFGQAVAAGLALWGVTVKIHNDPVLTSADPLAGLPLPPPPDKADGVPEDKPAPVVVK